MPLADAMKEPRRAKCRLPTEAELALAAEEARSRAPSERTGEKGVGVEAVVRSEGSDEPEEPEGGSTREDAQGEEEEEERPLRMSALSTTLGKRLRARTTDGEVSPRAKKRRPRSYR